MLISASGVRSGSSSALSQVAVSFPSTVCYRVPVCSLFSASARAKLGCIELGLRSSCLQAVSELREADGGRVSIVRSEGQALGRWQGFDIESQAAMALGARAKAASEVGTLSRRWSMALGAQAKAASEVGTLSRRWSQKRCGYCGGRESEKRVELLQGVVLTTWRRLLRACRSLSAYF